MHALVIEDQFLIATLIEEELRELGYTTVTLCDSEEHAIASAFEHRPHLITADNELSAGTGVDAVRAICAKRTIPVVFIVGNLNELNSPVPYSATVQKPFVGSQLRQAVSAAVQQAKEHGYLQSV